ncbi:hypothetical protein D3C78_1301450 [compost metagenome]
MIGFIVLAEYIFPARSLIKFLTEKTPDLPLCFLIAFFFEDKPYAGGRERIREAHFSTHISNVLASQLTLLHPALLNSTIEHSGSHSTEASALPERYSNMTPT